MNYDFEIKRNVLRCRFEPPYRSLPPAGQWKKIKKNKHAQRWKKRNTRTIIGSALGYDECFQCGPSLLRCKHPCDLKTLQGQAYKIHGQPQTRQGGNQKKSENNRQLHLIYVVDLHEVFDVQKRFWFFEFHGFTPLWVASFEIDFVVCGTCRKNTLIDENKRNTGSILDFAQRCCKCFQWITSLPDRFDKRIGEQGAECHKKRQAHQDQDLAVHCDVHNYTPIN